VTLDFGSSKIAAWGTCVVASGFGGSLSALVFLGMFKAMEGSWDLIGMGPMAVQGAIIGTLTGILPSIGVTAVVFRNGARTKPECWTGVLGMGALGALSSFLFFVAWQWWSS
jgi:hypothetical protein